MRGGKITQGRNRPSVPFLGLRGMQKNRLKSVWVTLSTAWEPSGVSLPNVYTGETTRVVER